MKIQWGEILANKIGDECEEEGRETDEKHGDAFPRQSTLQLLLHAATGREKPRLGARRRPDIARYD